MIGEMDGLGKWLMARRGKFTASENYKLLVGGSGGNIFGTGAMTYIKEKALEMCTDIYERPELEEVKSLLHGKVYEYPAYVAYINATKNYFMKYLGTENPIFLEDDTIPGESGGSPDVIGMNTDTKIDAIAEIKCPKNPMYHFDRLLWKDQWDIKEGYMQCYCQMQNLLKISRADICQFISFDDRMRDKEKKIKIIDVYPDIKFQDNLDLRIRMAIKEKYKIYDKHMNAA